MAHLLSFAKPGCGGNARQKAALQAAGHTLEPRSLLAKPWTREALRLIRRPLMQHLHDGSRRVGFDTAAIDAWVGLTPAAAQRVSLEGCAQPSQTCTPPHAA